MKAKLAWIVGLMLLSFGLAQTSNGQLLTNHSFDLILEGDDPGQRFIFELTGDALRPSVLHFQGSFQNLASSDTVVTYYLSWPVADGSRYEGLAPGWVPLSGSGTLPITIDQQLGWSPAELDFIIEGGGPVDHFRFAGEFTIAQVPEPSVCALLLMLPGALLLRRLTKTVYR